MPELPEVESTVRFLRERLVGVIITSAVVHWHRSVATPNVTEFSQSLLKTQITEVSRRGKFVVVTLANEKKIFFLCIHLRMSGQLDIVPSALPVEKHDRVTLNFSNGKTLRFNDVRKFGKMYLVQDLASVTSKLGWEPLDDSFLLSQFSEALESSNRRMKTVLLDQSVIAGIGNIYADEALFRAGIHPATIASELSSEKIARLHSAIRLVLAEAIELSGTDFGDGVVYGGMFIPQIYGRTDSPCVRCGTPVQKIIVAQRGTHFCRKCQPRLRTRRRREIR